MVQPHDLFHAMPSELLVMVVHSVSYAVRKEDEYITGKCVECDFVVFCIRKEAEWQPTDLNHLCLAAMAINGLRLTGTGDLHHAITFVPYCIKQRHERRGDLAFIEGGIDL